MNSNKEMLKEIERETASTRRLLEVINDEHLAYKPHDKSMSLGELCTHIVGLHNWVNNALSVNVYDFHTMYTAFVAKSVEELIDLLDGGYADNVEKIKSMSDEEWQSIWTLQAGSYVIASMPKIEAYRFIIQNHLIHHRGQLTVYMRLLDISLPGIYGPSADDNKG